MGFCSAVWCAAILGLAGGVLGQEPAAKGDAKPLRVLWTVPTKAPSFGGAAIADVDGDGGLDIAFASYFGDSKVRVLRGRDGKEIWSFDAGHGEGDACLDASCRFADLMDDGKLELVVPVSNSSQVIAFEAGTGKSLWTYEAGAGECIDTPAWVGEIDGRTRVVVGTFKGRLHVIDAKDGSRVRLVQIAEKGAVQSCPVVMDLNGDRVKDYLATTFNGDMRVVAADGTGKDDGAVHGLWHIETKSKMLYHGPSVGDLDGDQKPDFAIGAYDGRVYAFHADGSTLWTTPAIERYIMAPTTIADLDGDGKPEVIATGDKITALRGKDGSVLWGVPFEKPGMYWSVTRGVSVADLDGDGEPDLAALNGRGEFKVLRGRDGATLYEFDASGLCEGKVDMNSHSPTIADLDGDGKLDVFFVVGHGDARKPEAGAGVAVCLTGFAGSARNKDGSPAGWFMMRHDPWNTGNVGTALPAELVKRLGGGRK